MRRNIYTLGSAGLVVLGLFMVWRLSPRHIAKRQIATGEQYLGQRKYRQAILSFQAALLAEPRSARALRDLGEALMANGAWSDAYSALRQAADVQPEDESIRLALGRLFLTGKQYTNAETEAGHVLKANPSNVAALELKAAAEIGEGRYEEARGALERLAEMQSGTAENLMDLGLVNLALGNLREAEGNLERAAALEPKSAKAQWNLANLYRLKHDPGRALEVLQAAVAANPGSAELVLPLADLEWSAGRQERAEALLRGLEQSAGATVEAKLKTGDFYLAHARAAAARRIYDAAAREAPQSMEAKGRQVDWYISQGQLREAAALNVAILRQDPDNERAAVQRGRILLEQGDSAAAVAVLRRVTALRPALVAGHYQLSRALARSGSIAESLAELRGCVRLDPGFRGALLDLAQTSMATGDFATAVQVARQAVQQRPEGYEERIELGRAYLGIAKAAAAEREIELGLNVNETPEGESYLALALAEQGRTEASEAHFRRAISMAPDTSAAAARLYTTYLLSRHEEGKALAMLDELAKRWPNNASLEATLAYVALRAGNLDRAQRAAEEAIRADPRMVEGHMLRAQVAERKQQPAAALAAYAQARRLAPRDPRVLTAIGNLNLAMGKMAQAAEAYQRALDNDPNFAAALGNLAWVEARRGTDLDEALGYAQRARELAPENLAIADTLAWIEHKRGLDRTALPLLEECVRVAPKQSLYRYHLGVVLIAAGDTGRGRMQLRDSLRGELGAEDASEANRLLESPSGGGR